MSPGFTGANFPHLGESHGAAACMSAEGECKSAWEGAFRETNWRRYRTRLSTESTRAMRIGPLREFYKPDERQITRRSHTGIDDPLIEIHGKWFARKQSSIVALINAQFQK